MDYADAHGGLVSACGCCGLVASDHILNEMSVAALQRVALDYAGLTNVLREETNDAPYVPIEVALTELLGEHALELADEVEGPLLEALSGTYVDADGILVAAASSASIWQAKAWPTTLEAKAGKLVSGAALTGAHDVPFGPLLSDLDRLRIVNGMIRSAKYATNEYFNTQVMPSLIDAANSAVLNGAGNDLGELESIRGLLDRRLRSVPYWNLVANAAASRAYHFGLLKVGYAAGYQTATFWNPNDERTSTICRAMYGTQWSVGDLVGLADSIANAADVDEVKKITPWLKPSDIAGLDPRQLLNLGVAIPPLHGRCRSKILLS